MTNMIDMNSVEKTIALPTGDCLVLLDRLAKEKIYGQLECARNILLLDSNKKIIWQIQSDFDSDSKSFTNIYIEEDQIKAYRWDGGIYEINVQNGMATPISLMK